MDIPVYEELLSELIYDIIWSGREAEGWDVMEASDKLDPILAGDATNDVMIKKEENVSVSSSAAMDHITTTTTTTSAGIVSIGDTPAPLGESTDHVTNATNLPPISSITSLLRTPSYTSLGVSQPTNTDDTHSKMSPALINTLMKHDQKD